MYSRKHNCPDCTHGADRIFSYTLTFEIQHADSTHLLTARELVVAMVQTLEDSEPGWFSDREGADWHIIQIKGTGGVLFDVDRDSAKGMR